MKRLFDIVLSALALLLTAPLMLIAALAVRLDSPGPILFRQSRVGKDFRPIVVLKFRSMLTSNSGSQVTFGKDSRITRTGRWLRKFKLDELPQLWNVLRGDMSFVGPRPEVPKYVDLYRDAYTNLLRVRPGITDEASIKYRSEAEILGSVDDPEGYYQSVILPDKIKMAEDYVRNPSILRDTSIILQTIAVCFRPNAMPAAAVPQPVLRAKQ